MCACAGDELLIVYPPGLTRSSKREKTIEDGIVQYGCLLEPCARGLGREYRSDGEQTSCFFLPSPRMYPTLPMNTQPVSG